MSEIFGTPRIQIDEAELLPTKANSKDRQKRIFKAISLINEKRPIDIQEIVSSEQSQYEPFLVLRALSLFQDTALAAAMVNERPILDNDMQVAFLLNTIRPRRRWSGKWPKASNDETIDLIARYYGMSLREAAKLVGLHSETELATMSSVVGKDHSCSRFR